VLVTTDLRPLPSSAMPPIASSRRRLPKGIDQAGGVVAGDAGTPLPM
jgi:hypothetical protein